LCFTVTSVLGSWICVLEFIEFVVNQELCRKQWLEATEQCAELTTRCNEVQHDNEALQTKLKHARFVHNDFLRSQAVTFNVKVKMAQATDVYTTYHYKFTYNIQHTELHLF